MSRIFCLLFVLALSLAPARAEIMNLDVVAKKGAAPIRFEAERSAVRDMGDGYQVDGDVALAGPARRLTLAGASLFFAFAPGSRQIERVRGKAFVPSPYEGPHVEIRQPARAEFGMDFGRNISYGIPLHEERTYFFFKFESGFSMAIGAKEEGSKPLELTIPAGVKAMFLLDPEDLFFFVGGGLLLPEGEKSAKTEQKEEETKDTGGETAGIGYSMQSLIPFRPRVTRGIEEKAREFGGNLLLAGTLPLGKLPVVFRGVSVSDVNRWGTGQKAIDPLEISMGPWAQAGINGSFAFGFPFLKVKKLGALAEFGFQLGNATAALEVVNDKQHAYFSGELQPDLGWVPDIMPLKPEGKLLAYSYVSGEGHDFVLHAEGRYAVDASTLGKWARVDLGTVFETEGLLRVDRHGFRLVGETSGNLGALGIAQHRRVELYIPFDETKPGLLRLDGMNRVLSLRVRGTALITAGVASIEGKLDTNQVDVSVRAAIETPQGQGTRVVGSLSVAEAWNLGLREEVLEEARIHRDTLAKTLAEYEETSKNYELELSLRGMRSVIPGVCDAILRTLSQAEKTAHARIEDRWPWYAPGKGSAKSRATNEINAHEGRIRNLRSRVLQGDNNAVRAALESAIREALAYQRVKITVPVVGTVYEHDYLSSTNEKRLRAALAGVQALPAASQRKVKAEAAWKAAPKREELLAAAGDIVNGVAGRMPSIRGIGFAQPLGTASLELYVTVVCAGKESVHRIAFDMGNPLDLGKNVGKFFRLSL